MKPLYIGLIVTAVVLVVAGAITATILIIRHHKKHRYKCVFNKEHNRHTCVVDDENGTCTTNDCCRFNQDGNSCKWSCTGKYANPKCGVPQDNGYDWNNNNVCKQSTDTSKNKNNPCCGSQCGSNQNDNNNDRKHVLKEGTVLKFTTNSNTEEGTVIDTYNVNSSSQNKFTMLTYERTSTNTFKLNKYNVTYDSTQKVIKYVLDYSSPENSSTTLTTRPTHVSISENQYFSTMLNFSVPLNTGGFLNSSNLFTALPGRTGSLYNFNGGDLESKFAQSKNTFGLYFSNKVDLFHQRRFNDTGSIAKITTFPFPLNDTATTTFASEENDIVLFSTIEPNEILLVSHIHGSFTFGTAKFSKLCQNALPYSTVQHLGQSIACSDEADIVLIGGSNGFIVCKSSYSSANTNDPTKWSYSIKARPMQEGLINVAVSRDGRVMAWTSKNSSGYVLHTARLNELTFAIESTQSVVSAEATSKLGEGAVRVLQVSEYTGDNSVNSRADYVAITSYENNRDTGVFYKVVRL